MASSDHNSRIDLNSDLGEFDDQERRDLAEGVLSNVTSANIACGFHAGNPQLMRWTIACARKKGVAIGAHPGFNDPEHFGRRVLPHSVSEIENLVAYQVGALAAIAAMEGVALAHVKPHGALYGLTVHDRQVAEAFARSLILVDRALTLVGLAGSELIQAGRRMGLTVAQEAFADRAYHSDGTLVSREREGSVILEPIFIVDRAITLVQEGVVRGLNGEPILVQADTICIHGDTPGADHLVKVVREGLTKAGIMVRPLANDAE